MKYENENILGIVALCAFMALVIAVVGCVIAGNIKAALIIWVITLFCGAVCNACAYDEYVIVEYYYEEDGLD